MAINKEYHAKRMGQRLPKAMQSGVKINTLLTAFAEEMILMSESSKLLMQSRWYSFARGWSDPEDNLMAKRATEIGRIATLFGLFPGRNETTGDFRKRLKKYVRIHRDGLGNIHSILRLAALVYRSKADPLISIENNVNAHFSVSSENDEELPLTLELEENPIEPEEITFTEMQPGKSYDLVNNTLDYAIPELTIKTDKARGVVSVPMLIHKESGTRILYVGKLSNGAQLQLKNKTPPRLLRNNAVQSGGFCFDSPDAKFDRPSHKPRVRFGGPKILMIGSGSRFDQVQTCFGKAYFAAFGINLPFPELKPGKNHWIYRTVSRKELKSYLMGGEDAKELLENAEDDEGPPINLTLSWKGKVPACFSLKIPGDYTPAFFENFKELQVALNRMLQYGRAAGVTARLEPVLNFKDQLKVSDSDLKLHTDLFVSEENTPDDIFKQPDIAIKFEDQIIPEDLYVTAGVYNSSYFNNAVYKDLSKINEAKFNKDKYNESRFKIEAKFNKDKYNESIFKTKLKSKDTFETNEAKFDKDKYNKSIFTTKEKDHG
ncbi:MAG: hypothetical protein GY714_15120 [Desulfobacterales bacterium]|nr:hypothetical protein [Desulfobacterales bacterium]MCP4162117.1 hypothetical protein [Deltaproteobacteria bacterium]